MNMNKIKITVMRKTVYDDLIEKYENPIEHACDIKIGQVFISENAKKQLQIHETSTFIYFQKSYLSFVKQIVKLKIH